MTRKALPDKPGSDACVSKYELEAAQIQGIKALLLASAGIVACFLFRAARELFAAGEKAFSAFLTLLTVFAKTVPPILIAGDVRHAPRVVLPGSNVRVAPLF